MYTICFISVVYLCFLFSLVELPLRPRQRPSPPSRPKSMAIFQNVSPAAGSLGHRCEPQNLNDPGKKMMPGRGKGGWNGREAGPGGRQAGRAGWCSIIRNIRSNSSSSSCSIKPIIPNHHQASDSSRLWVRVQVPTIGIVSKHWQKIFPNNYEIIN